MLGASRSRFEKGDSMVATAETDRDTVEAMTRGWWILLVAGAIWLIFGWVVLSARSNSSTVWAITVYAGILFFVFGLGELLAACVVPGWRWLHGVLALAGIGAGVVA